MINNELRRRLDEHPIPITPNMASWKNDPPKNRVSCNSSIECSKILLGTLSANPLRRGRSWRPVGTRYSSRVLSYQILSVWAKLFWCKGVPKCRRHGGPAPWDWGVSDPYKHTSTPHVLPYQIWSLKTFFWATVLAGSQNADDAVAPPSCDWVVAIPLETRVPRPLVLPRQIWSL